MNTFAIINQTDYEINIKELEDLLNYALKKEKVQNAEFSIIFVDNEKIKEINRQYRGIDKVTDVISFALEDDRTFPITDIRMLGDIFVSVDKMKTQAQEYGTGEKRECAFLIIHGLLHLLGYDHMTKDEEKIMFKRQEEILDGYGITR